MHLAGLMVDRTLMGRVIKAAPGSNPDPRPVAERAAADAEVRRMSDQEVRDAVGEPNFGGALYLQQNPDVAAHPVWGRDPARHYLAYGQYEGRPYPGTLPIAAPAPAPVIEVRPVYQVPALPSTADLFSKVTQVAPAPASSTPMQVTPIAAPSPSIFDVPLTTSYAPTPTAAPAAPAKKALPSWAIPAALGAAALVVLPLLLNRKGPRHA